ncbi:torsin-1A-interacting protein 1 [Suncus etruscus]|uniref:torsin-1A-interacting protein 1 n=1 Tax=Suncus etruscus TaxID=109475 RepID=UPI002110C690|nr:torsin-1A-interacting protein 1 [Suncus etruscus]
MRVGRAAARTRAEASWSLSCRPDRRAQRPGTPTSPRRRRHDPLRKPPRTPRDLPLKWVVNNHGGRGGAGGAGGGDWGTLVTPRAPLRSGRRRQATPPEGGDSDTLPDAPPSPQRPSRRREVRFSEAPPEVYGGDSAPAVSHRERLPGGKWSSREELRHEPETEEVVESAYYNLRSGRRHLPPPDPDDMKTRRVTRLQQQQQQQQEHLQRSPPPSPPAPATPRRALRDSRVSEEDEPSSQQVLSSTSTKKSMRTSEEIPSKFHDPVSVLRRPPLRSGKGLFVFRTNGSTKMSELEVANVQQRASSSEVDTTEDDDQGSSKSDESSAQLWLGESMQSEDQPVRSSQYSDQQSLQYQDVAVHDKLPAVLSSGYPKISQEWDEQSGGIRSRRPMPPGGKRSTYGGFSDDDSLPKSRNQYPPTSSHQEAKPPNNTSYLGIKLFFLLVMACGALYVWQRHSPATNDPGVREFQQQMQQLMGKYQAQDEKLWKRSALFLERHLNHSQPRPQPAVLLLAAAQDAEEVLRCLSQQIADAYSASWAHHSVPAIRIDGTGKAAQDSDAVKHEVDQELSTGFESGQRAAVVHRFESLPAGATLIFYKYCDHENAAFKDVALVLTVLLDDQTLGASPDLKQTEEKVRDFLRGKFIDHQGPSAHDRMDSDKLSGLWSRISHLVLPVQPEQAQKRGTCL